MSFETAAVLGIGACCVWMAYMAVNSTLQPHLRSLFVFMTMFGMIILVNQARVLARDASGDSNINVLLETTHASLIWFFGFIMAVYAIMAFITYFKLKGVKNGEVSISSDQYRTR